MTKNEPRVDTDALKARHPIAGVVGQAVDLKRRGDEFVGLCPFHNERTPSFTVVPAGGFFHCFGCNANGDVLDFVMQHDRVDFAEAIRRLGGGVDVVVTKKSGDRVEVTVERSAEVEAAALRKGERARRVWTNTVAITEDTLPARYLRKRGITAPIPDCLRYHLHCYHDLNGHCYPAMVAKVVDADGMGIAIHRTYLDARRIDKVATPIKDRLLLGRTRGGSIRLAPAGRGIMVAEAIEDGLSVQQATGRPVWAAPSASFLGPIDLPDTIEHVIFCADGDDAGRRAVEAAAARLARPGRVLETVPLGDGVDMNKLLRL